MSECKFHKEDFTYCQGCVDERVESERTRIKAVVEAYLKDKKEWIEEHRTLVKGDYSLGITQIIDTIKRELLSALDPAEGQIFEEMSGGIVRRFDINGDEIKKAHGTEKDKMPSEPRCECGHREYEHNDKKDRKYYEPFECMISGCPCKEYRPLSKAGEE